MKMNDNKVYIQNEKTFLKDLSEKAKDIINWVKNNPTDDYLCGEIEIYEDYSFLSAPNGIKRYIAGSKALAFLIRCCSNANYGDFIQWNPNDCDIFVLNQIKSNCHDIHPGLQIVNVVDKSIEELLTSFDLPVCRVAIGLDDSNQTKLYFTAHAIYSLYKRKMLMPEYTSCSVAYERFLCSKFKDGFKINNDKVEIDHYTICNTVTNFNERKEKYLNRGFSMKYYNTDEILPFLYKRLTYLCNVQHRKNKCIHSVMARNDNSANTAL